MIANPIETYLTYSIFSLLSFSSHTSILRQIHETCLRPRTFSNDTECAQNGIARKEMERTAFRRVSLRVSRRLTCFRMEKDSHGNPPVWIAGCRSISNKFVAIVEGTDLSFSRSVSRLQTVSGWLWKWCFSGFLQERSRWLNDPEDNVGCFSAANFYTVFMGH